MVTRKYPDYTTNDLVEKVSLFNELTLYARDPNSRRPPVHAQSADVRRPGDTSGQEAITAQFRNASPLKREGGEGK